MHILIFTEEEHARVVDSTPLNHNLFYLLINFSSQAGRAPQQLGSITVAPFLPFQPCMIHNRRQITTPGTTSPTLSDKCVGSFTSHRIINIEGL